MVARRRATGGISVLFAVVRYLLLIFMFECAPAGRRGVPGGLPGSVRILQLRMRRYGHANRPSPAAM